MKRIAIFALMAAFMLSAAVAGAAELKVSNEFKTAAIWSTDTAGTFGEHTESNDVFNIYSRLRTEWSFTPANNDKINIYMRTEIGTTGWGREAFEIGDKTALMVDRLYLDFFWPETNISFRAGLQPVTLWNSSVVGASSAILDDDVAAFQITAPINDMITIAAGYIRAIDNNKNDTINATQPHSKRDEFDVVYLGLPLTFDGFAVSPFGAVGFAGKDVTIEQQGEELVLGENVNPWWLGVAFDFTMLENFGFGADFNYGAVNAKERENDMKGWIADFAFEYTGLSMMTPKLLFAYGSGEDSNEDNGSERMPTISGGWGGMTNNLGDASDLVGVSDFNLNPEKGVWGVELGLLDINFIEKLSNDVKFGYWQGTNSKTAVEDGFAGLELASGELTTKDYAFEVDLDTKYQIYEELYVVLELGYSYLNADRGVWGKDADNLRNNWRGGLGVKAAF